MSADTLDRLSEKITKILGMLNQLDQFAGGPGTASMGRGGSGGSVMPNSLAQFSSAASKGGLALGLAQTALSTAGGVAGGVSMMMPDVGATVARMGGFYTAGVMSAGSMSAGRLKAMIDKNLTTMSTPGAGANLAALLTSRGMAPSSFGFAQTLSATASATKYLGIPTEAAGAAIERMTSGSSSANLMRQGIFTSDPYTGNIKSTTQIFEELYARSTAGRPKMNVADTMEDIRRGFTGENIKGYGFDAATEEMYKAFIVAKAGGKTLNFEDQKSIDAAMKANEAAGFENPYLSSYKLAKAEDRNMEAASQPYLQGIKDATGALIELKNFTHDTLIPTFGQLNAAIQTFAGNNTGAGLLGAGGSALSGVASMAGQIGSFMLANKALNMLGGGAKAAPALSGSKLATAGSKLLKVGGPAAIASIAGTVAGDAIKGNAAQGSDQSKWGNALSTGATWAGMGAMVGSIVPGLGTGIGAAVGGGLGALYGAFTGGSESGIGTGGTTDTGMKSFGTPTSGAVSAGYGQKGSIWSRGYHTGTDYAVPTGTKVYAAAAGTVSKSQHGSGSHSYGLYVAIEHGNGYVSIYAHLSQALVSPGQTVERGQLIARSGESGHVTGPHLHFEVQKNGVPVDPGSLSAFAGKGDGKDAKPGDSKQNGTSGNNVLDTVLGVGRTAGLPITTGMSGVKGNYEGTMERVGSGLRMGAVSLYSPVTAATGMVASAGTAQGGSASAIALGSTTDTTGGLQMLQTAQVSKTKAHGQQNGGNVVTIHLNVQRATEDEAKKFAHMVKTMLEDDSALEKIGRR